MTPEQMRFQMLRFQQLHDQLERAGYGMDVCNGIDAFGSTGRATFEPSATEEQRNAVNAIVAAFQWEETKDEKSEKLNWETCREKAREILRNHRESEIDGVSEKELLWAMLQLLTPEEPMEFDSSMRAKK